MGWITVPNAYVSAFPPVHSHSRRYTEAEERQRENGNVHGLHKPYGNQRSRKPKEVAALSQACRTEQPDQKTGQAEQTGCHADLNEDVMRINENLAGQDVLKERKRCRRVHRVTQLPRTGPQ
jgi:hypothetical protein